MTVSRSRLRAQLLGAVQESGGVLRDSNRVWVRRARQGRGDYTSNIAQEWAASGMDSERAIDVLKAALTGFWPGSVEEASGFLNLRLDESFLNEQVSSAVRQERRWGATDALKGEKINVEFVSAEPAGPLSFEAGRIAASGESLCRLLELQGARVTREYFLNDAEDSSKMRLMGESVAAWYGLMLRGGNPRELPEGTLRDEFVKSVAAEIVRADGDTHLSLSPSERALIFTRRAREVSVRSQKETLERFGVRFDVWSSENALSGEGRIRAALEKLRARGHVYERGGGVWLRTSAFGDEADRPLMRSNGRATYLAVDIAYHFFKLERGFDRIINIWTQEHEPYVKRTRAALQAAGSEEARVEVLLCREAEALRDDTPVLRGKGGAFTLDEALQEVEADSLRFHFLSRAWHEPLAIDLEASRRDDESNPAYEARLLPSRLATMLGQAQARNGDRNSNGTNGTSHNALNFVNVDIVSRANQAAPRSEAERELMRLVAVWPDEAETAAREREPQRVARFVSEMAAQVRVLLKQERPSSSAAPERIALLRAAQITAVNALRVLGIEANEQF